MYIEANLPYDTWEVHGLLCWGELASGLVLVIQLVTNFKLNHQLFKRLMAMF